MRSQQAWSSALAWARAADRLPSPGPWVFPVPGEECLLDLGALVLACHAGLDLCVRLLTRLHIALALQVDGQRLRSLRSFPDDPDQRCPVAARKSGCQVRWGRREDMLKVRRLCGGAPRRPGPLAGGGDTCSAFPPVDQRLQGAEKNSEALHSGKCLACMKLQQVGYQRLRARQPKRGTKVSKRLPWLPGVTRRRRNRWRHSPR